MSHETATGEFYSCDAPNCPVRHFIPAEDGLPDGFHGQVTQVTEAGGGGEADWYACKPAHIGPAVLGALTEQEKKS